MNLLDFVEPHWTARKQERLVMCRHYRKPTLPHKPREGWGNHRRGLAIGLASPLTVRIPRQVTLHRIRQPRGVQDVAQLTGREAASELLRFGWRRVRVSQQR